MAAALALIVLAWAPAPAAAQPAVDGNPLFPPAAVQYRGAPVPGAFPPEAMLSGYRSDLSGDGGDYHRIIDQFPLLRANAPQVMRANMETVRGINNAAGATTVERALADDHDDLLLTMSDAWGPTLSEHFRRAVGQGRLPKTTQLLSGSLARAGGPASSTFTEKYLYNQDRPFVVHPAAVVRHHREGAGDEYSTSPSFPSGHTSQATWKSILLATMLPEFGPQMLARGSEVGYNRIVLGVHYPLDVIGGRMTGMAAAADRLGDPRFRTLIDAAATELRAELEWRCGTTVADCAATDTPYLSDERAVAVYGGRMDYGLPKVGPTDLGIIVPDTAQILISGAHPQLGPEQRAELLGRTAASSGSPLDRPGADGSWQRLNLAAAWTELP